MTEDFVMEPERKESKEVKAENKTSQSHMLVATLIATITFAAGFAIPVIYEAQQGSDKGMVVLVREAGFKAFFVANTIAVMCSTSSVLCYVFATLYDDDHKRAGCYLSGFYLVLVAVVAMTVGFLSATFATLVHSIGLWITLFIIAGVSCVVYFRQLMKFSIYILFQKFLAKSDNRARGTLLYHTTKDIHLPV